MPAKLSIEAACNIAQKNVRRSKVEHWVVRCSLPGIEKTSDLMSATEAKERERNDRIFVALMHLGFSAGAASEVAYWGPLPKMDWRKIVAEAASKVRPVRSSGRAELKET